MIHRKDIASILITYGCNVNSIDNDGKTALHYAYESGDDDMIEYLIKNGLDESLLDYFGKTASDYAP